MNLQALCTRREQKQGQVTQAPPGHILVEYAGPSVRPVSAPPRRQQLIFTPSRDDLAGHKLCFEL